MRKESAVFLVCLLVLGCGSSPGFRVTSFLQDGAPSVPLNETLVIRFSDELDRSSIHSQTISLVDDQGKPGAGQWTVQGREARFHPRPPRKPDYSDTGLSKGREYYVRIQGFPCFASVLSARQVHLDRSYTFSFRTAAEGEGRFLVDPTPHSGPRLKAVNGCFVEDLGLDGVIVEPGKPLILEFSETLDPASLKNGRSVLWMIDRGQAVDEENPLDLKCGFLNEEDSTSRVALEPLGGFEPGRTYKLTSNRLEFTDLGNHPVENESFRYLWIICPAEDRSE